MYITMTCSPIDKVCIVQPALLNVYLSNEECQDYAIELRDYIKSAQDAGFEEKIPGGVVTCSAYTYI